MKHKVLSGSTDCGILAGFRAHAQHRGRQKLLWLRAGGRDASAGLQNIAFACRNGLGWGGGVVSAGGAADTVEAVRSDRRRVLDVASDQVGNVRTA